jgi:hypothetical protein
VDHHPWIRCLFVDILIRSAQPPLRDFLSAARVLRVWYRLESRLFGSPKPTSIDKDGKK